MIFVVKLFQYCLVLPIGCAILGIGVNLIFGASIHFEVPAIIGLSLFSIYVFDRAIETVEDDLNTRTRTNYFRSHRQLFLCLAIGAQISSFFVGASHSWEMAVLSLVPIIVVYFYSIGPKLSIFGLQSPIPRLKNVLALKNVIVAGTLTVMVVLVPNTADTGAISTLQVSFLCLILFLRFLINGITFDIRDIAGDIHANVRTIPAVIGKDKTLQALHMLNIAIGALLIGAVRNPSIGSFTLWLLPSCLFTALYLCRLKFREPRRIFYDVVIDSEFLIWGLLMILSQAL
jgi:4-hydroxybenzoate polyprenyltransferase